MTTEHMDLEAEAAMLEALVRDVHALPGRISRARQIAQEADAKAKAAELAHHGALSAHRLAMDEVTARQVVEHESRKRELAVQSAELAERERAVEEKDQRATARLRDAENRAADLSNRLHGHAA
jgi:hypothetical protein